MLLAKMLGKSWISENIGSYLGKKILIRIETCVYGEGL